MCRSQYHSVEAVYTDDDPRMISHICWTSTDELVSLQHVQYHVLHKYYTTNRPNINNISLHPVEPLWLQ